MATWEQFERAEPELAAAGRRLFGKQYAYLATVSAQGAPRVHPTTPILSGGRLFISVSDASPKRRDLDRDGRYALHALPGPDDGEFYLTGRARRNDDATTKAQAHEDATFTPRASDPLFEFEISTCLWSRWENVGQPGTYPVRRIWHDR
ncbi:MAG: pyridoxamine 5'-phosphate oxidase family protein [Chloroflexi bacterium]|nr:pyridoxamine 5'-phosphate oxidase family protein [Chloroflexota bacterium]